MDKINNIIHQPIRLNILTTLHLDKQMTFSELKKELNLSDGNLGTHLEKLEQSGYIKIEKSFLNKKPRSTISILEKGENDLIEYISAIENLIKGIKK